MFDYEDNPRLERKDENGGGDLAAITREIKSFGDNVKGLKDSLSKDLADVRKIAEDAAKSVSGSAEFKAQLDAMTKSVAEKQAAIEAIANEAKAKTEAIETAMARSPRGEASQDEKKSAEDALRFFEIKASKLGHRADPKTIDRDGYKAWEAEFKNYIRANDERSIEAKALAVGSNPDGGYLVPTATSARIIQKIFETSPLRRLATIETIGTSELEIPIDVDDLASGWVGETEARSDTATPQVGVQKIPVHEIYAKPKATAKFLEDAAISVEQWLAGKIADRFSRVEATGFVTGDGVNKPRGILSYAAGTGRDKIAQVVSGGATTVTADAIVKLPYEVKSAYLANAAWLMKRSTVQAVMLLKDGQGQYLWRPGLVAGNPSVLCGYNVEMADDMPAVAAGTLSIAFGDFRRGYTVVDRLGITTLRDPYSAKPFVEFYSRKRVGGAVTDFDAFVLMKISA